MLTIVVIVKAMDESVFSGVVEQGIALQQHFPELHLIAVGGTAAALYCRHRYSLDVDCVTSHLREQYEKVIESLEQWEGWKTNRKNPPVLILGERGGTELGLRQQRRTVPLQIASRQGLTVPTAGEILRIKAFLLSERRATRDYVDVAALSIHLGEERTLHALSYMNPVYPGTQAQSMVSRFAEASESEPVDLADVPLTDYRGLRPPFNEWSFVSTACRDLGHKLLKLELTGSLPQSLDEGFYEIRGPNES